jgi:hypothetical protein
MRNQFSKIGYDEANISAIRNAWATERKNPTVTTNKAYTMVQANAPCEVEITLESRKACAEALLR